MDKETAQQRYRQASRRYASGDYVEALALLEKLLDHFPNEPRLNQAREQCLEKMRLGNLSPLKLREYVHEKRHTIMLPGRVPLEMVWIEPGTFMMGAYPDEQDSFDEEFPQHQVSLTHGFWMGKYTVTQAQWKAVVGSNPSLDLGANRPVVSVSWDDCQVFAAALNATTGEKFRFPTEAEWEYACRAGTTTRFYWGDDPSYSAIANYAWYDGIADGKGHKEVGGKLPNAWGLYDMIGNVSEWCQDWYGDYSAGSVTDPKGPANGDYRVQRGGSYSSAHWYCRSAYRNSNEPEFAYRGFGFRLAR